MCAAAAVIAAVILPQEQQGVLTGVDLGCNRRHLVCKACALSHKACASCRLLPVPGPQAQPGWCGQHPPATEPNHHTCVSLRCANAYMRLVLQQRGLDQQLMHNLSTAAGLCVGSKQQEKSEQMEEDEGGGDTGHGALGVPLHCSDRPRLFPWTCLKLERQGLRQRQRCHRDLQSCQQQSARSSSSSS